MISLLLIYTILFLWAYLVYKVNKPHYKEPPLFDHHLPIIGHLHFLLNGDQSHFLALIEILSAEAMKHGGSVFRVMIGFKPFYLISDPDDCYTVANTCLSKPTMPYGFLDNYVGLGVFGMKNGHAWKARRKMLNPAFSQSMLDEFTIVFNEETCRLLHELDNYAGGGPFDPLKYFQHVTLKNIIHRYKPFLEIVLELEENGAITRKELMSEIHTIIAGGYHTTSVALTLIVCAIGTYPKVQERIHEELLEVFGKSDRDVEKSDLSKLAYLEAVIKETLRLYPIAPVVARQGEKSVKLKEYTIPENSFYILLYNATNRMNNWGPDKDMFKPERWFDPSTIPEKSNAFCTFSIGRRNCIGRAYAMNFMKIACAHILRRYTIKGNIHKVQMSVDLLLQLLSGHEITIEKRVNEVK